MPLLAIIPCAEIHRARDLRLDISRRGAEAVLRWRAAGCGFESVGAQGCLDGCFDARLEEAEHARAFLTVFLLFCGIDVRAFCLVCCAACGVVRDCGSDFVVAGAESGVAACAVEVRFVDVGVLVRWWGVDVGWWWEGCFVGFADTEKGYC